MPIIVAPGNILEFKLVGAYNAVQETNNIFHYEVIDDDGATLDEFASGLWQVLKAALLPVTSNRVEYARIEAGKLDSSGLITVGETYIVVTDDGVGNVEQQALPPQDCWTFKYLRTEAGSRHGFKRFCGIPETQNNDGAPEGAALTALPVLASDLGGPIVPRTVTTDGTDGTVVGTGSMEPRILHRVKNGDILDPVHIEFVGGVVFDKIGTQNTRKFGVGS